MVSPLPDIRERVLALNDDALPQRYIVDGPVIRGTWKFDDPQWATRLSAGGASRHYALVVRLEPTTATFHVTESPVRGASLDVAGAFRDMLRRRTRGSRGGVAMSTADVVRPIIELLEADGWTNRGMPILPPRRVSPPTRPRR